MDAPIFVQPLVSTSPDNTEKFNDQLPIEPRAMESSIISSTLVGFVMGTFQPPFNSCFASHLMNSLFQSLMPTILQDRPLPFLMGSSAIYCITMNKESRNIKSFVAWSAASLCVQKLLLMYSDSINCFVYRILPDFHLSRPKNNEEVARRKYQLVPRWLTIALPYSFFYVGYFFSRYTRPTFQTAVSNFVSCVTSPILTKIHKFF